MTTSKSLLIVYCVRVVYYEMEDSTQNDREGDPSTPPVNEVTPANLPLATGLSAENVQKIATAVAALVGRPGASNNSKNPLVSGGPPQVPVPPSTGMQLLVVRYLRRLTPPYPSCTYVANCFALAGLVLSCDTITGLISQGIYQSPVL